MVFTTKFSNPVDRVKELREDVFHQRAFISPASDSGAA
jgi:hypothetical protein